MKLDPNKCVGCGQCIIYCPVGAISRNSLTLKSEIDQQTCVECHTCYRSKVCPVNALEIEELSYPRSLREAFSDVLRPHKATGVLGRGTEEMKTNDVTGRLKPCKLGISVELGRPGVGASFQDLQTVAQSILQLGIEFEKDNPIHALMIDPVHGAFAPEVLSERFLSALLEFEIDGSRLTELYDALRCVEPLVDTVFSVAVSRAVDGAEDSQEWLQSLDEQGIFFRPNGKTNVGLGRPLEGELK